MMGVRKAVPVWVLAGLLFVPTCLASEYDTAFNRGRELMHARNYVGAAAAFETATALRPTEVDAWFRLGLARSAGGEGDAAVAAYLKVAELDATHAKARNNIANVFFRRGDYDEALLWYERALDIDPDYLLAKYHQGWVMRHHNRNEQAEAAFMHCLQLEPKNERERATRLDCLFFVGTMRFRAEDYAAAANTMEQVLAVIPGHVESHYYLGTAYRRLGRIDEARRELELHRRMLRAGRRETAVERVDP